jgi:glycosyltransferase involved in cell wall biosynthesis
MTLSICIPCFNGAPTIGETFRSVLAQEVGPFELLVADNGSSDGSREIIEQLVRDHPCAGAVMHSFDKPLGMAADWNRLVRLARGELVLVLACDDVLEAGAVAAHLGAFECGEARVVLSCGPKRLVTARGRTLPFGMRRLAPGFRCSGEAIRAAVSRADNIIGEPSGVVFRREDFIAVGGFDESLRYFADLDLWLRLHSRGGMVVNREPLYRFRVHAGSLTSGNQRLALAEWVAVYGRFASMAGLASSPSLVLKARARMTLLARRTVISLLHRF